MRFGRGWHRYGRAGCGRARLGAVGRGKVWLGKGAYGSRKDVNVKEWTSEREGNYYGNYAVIDARG